MSVPSDDISLPVNEFCLHATLLPDVRPCQMARGHKGHLDMSMGQKPVPPVNIPIPTKID